MASKLAKHKPSCKTSGQIPKDFKRTISSWREADIFSCTPANSYAGGVIKASRLKKILLKRTINSPVAKLARQAARHQPKIIFIVEYYVSPTLSINGKKKTAWSVLKSLVNQHIF